MFRTVPPLVELDQPALKEGPAVPDQSDVSSRTWWYRRHNAIAATLLAFHAVLLWLNRAATPGLFHDEAHYMLLAKSLRQFRYEDFFLIGSPVHSQYPPGTPALHALLGAVFGDKPGVLIAGSILCSVGALACAYDIVRRCAGAGLALVVLGLAAVNPEIVVHHTRPLSEAPYMFFSLLALWAMVRTREAGERHERLSRWGMLAVVGTVFAALNRMVGVTLFGAMFLVKLWERRFRHVALLAVIGSVSVGSWFLWTTFAPGKLAGRSYVADMTVSEPGRKPDVLPMLGRRLRRNVTAYTVQHVPKDLPQPKLAGVAKRIPLGAGATSHTVRTADTMIALLFAALIAVGAVRVWAIGARIVVAYVVLYAGLMAIWPYHNSRFFVPLVPLLLWFVLMGALALVRRQWLRPLPWLFAAGIAGMALGRVANLTRDSLRCPRSEAQTSPACSTESERGLFEAFSFIRSALPDSAAVLSTVDTQLSYFTGRRSLFSQTADTTSAAALVADLRNRGVEYVLVTPFRTTGEQYLPLLIQSCQGLELLQQFTGQTLLLHVIPAGRPPSTQSCAALRAYASRYP